MALAFAGSPVVAAMYAVVAGFGIGAVSPLVGMHSRSVFGAAGVETAMGRVTLVFHLASAVGQVSAGWVADTSGSRAFPVLVSAGIVGAAGLVVSGSD